jgi:transcriptional regulator with XRE-family HTH domain
MPGQLRLVIGSIPLSWTVEDTTSRITGTSGCRSRLIAIGIGDPSVFWPPGRPLELTGRYRVNGYRPGDDQHIGGTLTRVKRMAKPKRGRSTAAVDDHVGSRIRERRIMLGLTQQQLAEMIGVTYQQAHKYERGINRVSAGRLFEIARALSAPITYFYEGVGEEGPRQITPHQRMLLEIARNFAEIRNEKHQEAVSQLARALASR